MPNNPNAKANLIPAEKGEVRNPKGRGKGNVNFNTLVKNILEDPKLVETITKGKRKPGWLANIGSKRMIEALIVAATVKGLQGDIQAIKWVTSQGYGTMFEPEEEEEKTIVVINHVARSKE